MNSPTDAAVALLSDWRDEREPVIEVLFMEGDDPIVTAVRGMATVNMLQEIEKDLRENPLSDFQEDGLYTLRCAYEEGESDEYGRAYLPPGWCCEFVSFRTLEAEANTRAPAREGGDQASAQAPAAGDAGLCMVALSLASKARPNDAPAIRNVPAYRVNEFFAVHPEVYEDNESKRTELTGDYVATHLPSGLTAITAPSLETCIKGAEALTELPVDWRTLRKDDVSSLPEDVRMQVKVIRATASIDGDLFTQSDMDAIDAAMTGGLAGGGSE